jgi:hypothetical protein
LDTLKETKEKKMSRILAVVGILLIAGGLVSYPALFSYSERTLKTDFVKVEKQWNIVWNFSEGENMSISFRADNDWSIASGLEEMVFLPPNGTTYFPYVKMFIVNVTDPLGDFTEVDVYLIIEELGGGVSKMDVLPDYFTVAGSSLVMEGGYPKAAIIQADNVIALGRVKHEGRYTVNCTVDPDMVLDRYLNNTLWIHRVSPPPELRLYKQKEEVHYPYRSSVLLPASGSVILAGCVVVLVGVRNRKTPRYTAKMERSQIQRRDNGFFLSPESS